MSSKQDESMVTANSYDTCNGLQDELSQLVVKDSFEKSRSDNVMFDNSILLAVQSKGRVPEVPVGFSVRPLEIEDCDKGYFELVGQTCSSSQINVDAFQENFRVIRRTKPLSVYSVVVENSKNKIVGAATLVVEFKFIHKLGARGRVKDLMIDPEIRRQGFGSILNYYMIEIALQIGVYKISLECSDELVHFFQKFGYIKDPGNNVMHFDFDSVEENLMMSKNNGETTTFHPVLFHNGRCDSSLKCLFSEVDSQLFNESALKKLCLDKTLEISENFRVRPLNVGDYKRGFLNLLEQLTVVGKISEAEFQKRFDLMRSIDFSKYLVVVVEDRLTQHVVGSATLFLDRHGFGTHGHVEDVVVDSALRGKKLGQLLNICLIDLARQLRVERITLECRDRLLTFYKQFGYKKRNNFMVKRFDE